MTRPDEAGPRVPRCRRAGPLAALAAAGALALAQGGGPDSLLAPARLLLLSVYTLLAARVAQLAVRLVVRARPSI